MIAGMAPLLEAVQHNCHVADARHARDMSLCAYLLEMREFYRWEHDLPPGAPLPRAEVGRWITEREALWESLADDEFRALPLAGALHEPFAVDAINRQLLPAGLVYGAGIGRFGKPHFFLARLERAVGEAPAVLVCGCEYARDLTALPAALQGGTVIVRREALRQWLWEKVEAWGVKRQPGAMARALAAYGYDEDDPAGALARMTEREAETLILHERGEYAAGQLLEPAWAQMLAGFATKRAELVARAVRDNLADCLTTLPTLLEAGSPAALHFWFANFDGLRRELFPQLAAAYDKVSDGDTPLRAAVAVGATHWLTVARRLLSLDEDVMAELAGDPAPVAL